MAKNITKAKHRFPVRELRHLGKLLSQNWPVIALSFVTGLLIFLNYEPGTFLTGWDNLHPEFDIAEALRRSFFSVWAEYRGTGLLSGMAEAADLPRVLFIALLLAVKVAPDLIRYLTTFLPLVLGPLGVYFLFYNHLFKGKLDSRTIQFASFLGALYYLLNLNTLQTFFVPFETFTAFYGALPWLLFFTLTYLTHPSRKNLLLLFLVSFLSAPSFYVETIFLVFIVITLPFLAAKRLRTSLASLTAIIVPHLFWLLPVAFFVITNGSIPQQAKNNLLSSPETHARNLQFATLKDTALMKGYLFNYLDLGQDNKYTYLLNIWRNHLHISVINLLGFLSFALITTGLYYSFKKKFAWTKSFVAMFALCLFFLFGGGAGELFRSPFTKFSIPLSLTYSFFFAIGTIFLLDLFTFLHSRLTYYLTLFTVAFSLILFMSPAFSGNLISPSLRQTIPPEYFDLFSFMRTQDPATRIANFPQFTGWGWLSYDFGYRGSGFLWYGLRQPLLDRAFDVWDKNSERYYEEMSTALYSADQKGFENVMNKYAVGWILIDEHITLPENATDSGLLTLKKFVTDTNSFTLTQTFGDQISLYKVNLSQPVQNFVIARSDSDLPADATHQALQAGAAIQKSFPFANLSLRPNTSWTSKGEYLNLTVPVSAKTDDTLTIPSLTSLESLIPVRIEYRKLAGSLDLRLTPIIPTVFADDSQLDLSASPITISLPATSGTGYILQLDKDYFELQLPSELDNFSEYYPLTIVYLPTQKPFSVALFGSSEISVLDLTDKLTEATPTQCYTIKPNHKVEKIVTQTSVSLIGTDVVGCLSAPLPGIAKGNLISLAFNYSSPTFTTANVNISGKDLSAQNLPQALEPQAKSTRARLFVPSSGTYQQVNLLLEAGETKSVQEINYDNLQVSVLPLLYSGVASLPAIPEKNIVLKNAISKIQVSLPNTTTQYDLQETPRSNSLFPENLNCDQWSTGKTVKQVTPDGFLYQSQNANECDSLSLRNLPHSLNYLFSFDYRFQKGLPPTVCLENHSSRRCDIQERLLKTGEVQSIIQPVSNPHEASGYTLHLYNQSFNNRITSNLLKSISIRPIPLHFLQQISLSDPVIPDPDSSSLRGGTPTRQSIQISSSHPSPFLYTISVIPSEARQSSTLSLFQTRSPFWQAIEVSPNDLKLPSWLLATVAPIVSPFLPKLPHADATLWHNAWLLPDSSLRDSSASRRMNQSNPSPTSILIFYLPQYLEFLGLFLLLLTPLAIILQGLALQARHKKPSTKKAEGKKASQ